MRRRLLDGLASKMSITRVREVGSAMRRLQLHGPDVHTWSWAPGQQVRVQVTGMPGPLDFLTGLRRTYSVWDISADTLELCVFDHGDGPGAQWARTAKPGDDVLVSKPQGDFVLRPSGFHLLVGDETAMAPIGAMMRAVPSGEQAQAVLEIDSPENALPVPGTVRWLYRQGRPAASSPALLGAVRELLLPGDHATAYVAGEARTVQAIRNHLVTDRGWDRRDIRTKPFWTPGKKGME